MFPFLLRLLLATVIASSAGFGVAVADKVVVGFEHVRFSQLGWLSMFLSALLCRVGFSATEHYLGSFLARSFLQ